MLRAQQGGPVVDLEDAQYSPLYDSLAVAAAAIGTSVRFFDVPQSATKGPESTNMTKANELPAGHRFDVFAMRLVCYGFVIVDLLGVMNAYALRLVIGAKTYLEAPLAYFAGGIGPVSPAAATTTSQTNGVADPRAVALIPSNLVIPIAAGDPFYCELRSLAGYTQTVAARWQVILEGIRYGDVR